MNNKTVVVGAAALLIGGGIGFWAGFTYAEKKHQEYIDGEFQEDLVKLRDLITDNQNVVDEETEEEVEVEVVEEENLEEVRERMSNMIDTYGGEFSDIIEEEDGISYIYNPSTDSYVPLDDELEYEEDDLEEDEKEDFVRSNPDREAWRVSIIDSEEWRKGEAGQYQEDYTYYELDDVLVDGDGIPVEDDNLFGDALDNFGTYDAKPDQVFVRNREERIDARITKVKRAFHEDKKPSSKKKKKVDYEDG